VSAAATAMPRVAGAALRAAGRDGAVAAGVATRVGAHGSVPRGAAVGASSLVPGSRPASRGRLLPGVAAIGAPARPWVATDQAPQASSPPGGRSSRRALLLAGLLALAGAPAAAQDPSFRLVNGGSVPIVEIRASPASDPAWGENRLPRGAALAPGGAFIVRLPPGDCVVDVRVVYATGQAQERRQVNACPILEMVFP
jgi:hypothetical protein